MTVRENHAKCVKIYRSLRWESAPRLSPFLRERTAIRGVGVSVPGLGGSDLLRPFAAVDEGEHGHADGHAVGDLFEDERAAGGRRDLSLRVLQISPAADKTSRTIFGCRIFPRWNGTTTRSPARK